MENTKIEITWKNLNLKTASGKILLKDVSGQADPGTMTAIMGPSGSGKTTFLNALAGRIKSDLILDGSILINGHERDSNTWPDLVSYVSQFFYAEEWQTVFESLKFAAVVKLGESAAINKQIEEILNTLGLSEARDTFVEKLSGGERMRLSIGIEMIGNPSAIFLDEPTSGLDSTNALNILEILRKLAKSGKTIIVSIHQPSFEMLQRFDKLILTCKGSPVYDGSVEGCVKFFSDCGYDLPKNTNPSDFFIDTISPDPTSKEEGDKVFRALKSEWDFIKEDKPPKLHVVPVPIKGSKSCLVFLEMLKREMLNTSRNTAFLKARLFQKIFIALLLGFTYFQLGIENADIYSLRGVITFLIVNELFGIAGPILNKFPEAKKVIERERMSGLYSGYEAFFSKSLSMIVENLIFEIPYVLTVYYLIGLSSNFGTCVVFLIIISSLVIFSISYGLTVSTIAPNTAVSQALGITLSIFFILYSGAFNNPNTIPAVLRWLIWISPASYGFRAAIQNQLNNNTVNGIPGKAIVEDFGLSGVGIWPCILILWAYSLVVQLIGAFVLHHKTQNNLKIRSNEHPRIVYK